MNNRIQALDFLRACAVIVMIFSHAVYFFYSGENIWISVLTRTINTLTFSIFFFTSASATYLAFAHNQKKLTSEEKSRLFHRVRVLLVGYYLLALTSFFTLHPEINEGTLSTIFDILTLKSVPAFTDILLPFLFYALLTFPFKPLFNRLANHPVTALVSGTYIYCIGIFLYTVQVPDWAVPYKALFVGSPGLNRYPVLMYFPLFTIGLAWGKILQKKTHTIRQIVQWVAGSACIVCITAYASYVSTYPVLDPAIRWPPSVGFLAVGAGAVFSLLALYELLSALPAASRILRAAAYIGKDAYDLYLTHLFLLFLYKGLAGPAYPGIIQFFLLFITLFIVSVVTSSINYSPAATVPSGKHLHWGLHARFRMKKRYIAAATITLALVVFVINRNPSSSKYGGYMTVPEPSPAPLFISMKRHWFSAPTAISDIHTMIITNSAYSIRSSQGVILADTDTVLKAGEYFVVSDNSEPISFYVTHPVYISWSLDWEGWGVSDTTLSDLSVLSKKHSMPFTNFVHPRLYITDDVTPQERERISDWLKLRTSDEIAMHIHAQNDFVKFASVAPKQKPSWGYKNGTGYDVYLTTYSPQDFQKMLTAGLSLFSQNGLPKPAGFRSGGWFSNTDMLQILSQNGFLYDSSGRVNEMWGGSVQSPWKLPYSTQPYYPSIHDMNTSLPPTIDIAEFPNTAGNTYEFDADTLKKPVLEILRNPVHMQNIYFVFMSHPQWADKELPVADEVLTYFDSFKMDLDHGPIIYATIKDMHDIWKQ